VPVPAVPPVAVEVAVEAEGWPPKRALSALSRRAVKAALRRTKPPLVPDCEVSVVFTNDARIRILNRQYRRKDKATNVLSFPGKPAEKGRFGPLLGDIVLARETMEKEAAAGHLTLEAHLTHLIVHGFLHLLGYDHEHDADAALMERLETVVLGDLGVADPYGGPAG
jgi:probable rRNA maturation factor